MPIVNVKGVANQMQFPDDMDINDIRAFLQKKFTQRAVGGESDALSPQDNIAAPYEPSLMERAGQGIADVLSDTGIISNRAGAQQIGKNVTSIGELLPGIGDVAAVDDFVRAKAKGDNLGMGLAALGVLPVAGDLAGKAGKTARKVFHGSDRQIDNYLRGTNTTGRLGAGIYFGDERKANVFAKIAKIKKKPSFLNAAEITSNNPKQVTEDMLLHYPQGKFPSEIFEKEGYTGIQLIDENSGKIIEETVFDPANIKSLNPASQAPVDAGKTLFKTHNVTEAGLRKADEFGGIPVPSLAIADRSAGFDDFGEISLIGEKGSFAKDPTFASDVYSPRTPKVTHDIDRAAARKEELRVSGDVDPRIDSAFSSQFEASNLEDDITRLESSAGNKAAFLSTIGKAINPDKFTSKPAKFKEPEWVKEFGFDLDSPVTFKSFDEPEFTQKADAFLSDLNPERDVPDWWDNGEMTREGKKAVLVSLRDISTAHQAAKGGPQFDRTKARAEIDKRIKKNQSSFDSYISDQKGRISKGKTFTKWNPKTSTNKKFEANLDNAVKLMKGNIRGGEGFGYGVGSIRAQVAPKLTSMKQITDRRGQIVGSDEMTMVKEGFNSRLDNLYDDLSGNWAFSSEPSYSDFADGIENAAKGDFGDFKNLSPNQKNELKGFFDELANAPTNYFEIKPQRAVDINEFFGAAVPEGTSKDVIAQLKAKGLKIEKYKPEKRLEAIEKLNIKSKGNIFFSGAGAALLYNVTKEDDKPTD